MPHLGLASSGNEAASCSGSCPKADKAAEGRRDTRRAEGSEAVRFVLQRESAWTKGGFFAMAADDV